MARRLLAGVLISVACSILHPAQPASAIATALLIAALLLMEARRD